MTKNCERIAPIGLILLSACGAEPASDSVGEVALEVRNGEIVTPFGPNPAPTFTRAIVQGPGNCTSTVLDGRWVLTAKHCNPGGGQTVTSVRPTGNVTRTAEQAVVHPTIDAALMRLNAPFDDTPSVGLYAGTTSDILARSVTCYGYGAKALGGACTSDADCPSGQGCNLDGRVCLTPSSELRRGTNTTFAATVFGYFHTLANPSGQIVLPGDSGGPDFIGNAIAGINSGWSNKGTDALHVSVPDVRAWLLNAMDASGFAWVDATTGSFDAQSGYSINSTGGTNRVTWSGVGSATVAFSGLGTSVGGNAQVTAYGSAGERCKVTSFQPNFSGGMDVNVRCTNSAGTAVSTPFAVSYVRKSGRPGAQGGYVWANQASAASYTPSSVYQWNSAGGMVTIDRTGTGSYSVNFPGQSFTGGTVEVTAYGNGSEYCKVQSWAPNGTSQRVRVRCFAASGTSADTLFLAKFTRSAPNSTASYGFVLADQPTAPSYTPDPTFQRGSIASGCGATPMPSASIVRTAVGRYTVTLPNLASSPPGARSHVKVTAHGSQSTSCKVINWFANGNNENINVACFNSAGAAADSTYTVTFSSTLSTVC